MVIKAAGHILRERNVATTGESLVKASAAFGGMRILVEASTEE